MKNAKNTTSSAPTGNVTNRPAAVRAVSTGANMRALADQEVAATPISKAILAAAIFPISSVRSLAAWVALVEDRTAAAEAVWLLKDKTFQLNCKCLWRKLTTAAIKP